MKTYKTLQQLSLSGKRVFVRVDFNVPLKQNAEGKWEVAETARIEGALETIRHIIKEGGKCILASHLGRPDGKPNRKYSLEPVGQKLSEYLEKDVLLTDDCIGDGPRGLSQQMRPGDVMLLENLRFHAGEEENTPEFVTKLNELCDVYVTDAFGAMHRAHASTVGLPKIAAQKGAGFLVQNEVRCLEPLRETPQRPFVLVMGGSKVSDKIGVLEQFLPKVDKVLIGGAMAYAFLRAQGHKIGNSLCEDKQVQLATKIMKGADVRKVQLLLPQDHLITKAFNDTENTKVTDGVEIPDGWMAVDVGPRTLLQFGTALQGAEMIFWNGPLGVFEKPAFAKGTYEMARLISESKAKKMAGGGDSAAAIANSGLLPKFDFISTGGGATLEYLEGKDLPGLKVLEVPRTSLVGAE